MREALFDLAGPVADELDRLGLNTVMKIQELLTKPKPPMSPEQARIEGLKAQVKRSQAAVKAERERQKIQSAQQSLNRIKTVATEEIDNHQPVKVYESQKLKTFQAQVRVVGDGNTNMAVTGIHAQNIGQARAILQRLFGKSNVISITEHS